VKETPTVHNGRRYLNGSVESHIATREGNGQGKGKGKERKGKGREGKGREGKGMKRKKGKKREGQTDRGGGRRCREEEQTEV
jgi:hypothetical protein